jgi:hypothetical protein
VIVLWWLGVQISGIGWSKPCVSSGLVVGKKNGEFHAFSVSILVVEFQRWQCNHKAPNLRN